VLKIGSKRRKFMKRKLFWLFLTIFSISLIFISSDRYHQSVEAQGFDMCLTDDNGGASMRFSSTTGDYQFCNGSKTLSGTGCVSKSGGFVFLHHSAADRRATAR